MANVYEPEWDAKQDRPPFTWRRARVGWQAGCKKLGASVFELPPGSSSFPLHVHYANEEIIVVLSGSPTLRTLESEVELTPGELVGCPVGRCGAHRLDNRGNELARVLIVSTMNAPELNEYPDTGRLWARTQAPGARPDGEVVQILGRPDPAADYLEGES
jgi:uncharacterized cupin superfamily protein